jgi:hypothetical protein
MRNLICSALTPRAYDSPVNSSHSLVAEVALWQTVTVTLQKLRMRSKAASDLKALKNKQSARAVSVKGGIGPASGLQSSCTFYV